MSDVVNVDQAAAWNGPEGEGWARDHEMFDRSLRHYREPMNRAAAIADGERVLDVGCGNGLSTRDAGRATPSGSVLGVDLSGPMLEVARRLTVADGLTNVEFLQADAQVHPFEPGSFDLVLSRFGVMFFADRVAAFTNLFRALKPGGRLLFVVWQALPANEQFTTLMGTLAQGLPPAPPPPPGAPSPFALADPEVGRAALEEAGFVDVHHESVCLPFDAGSDPDSGVAFADRAPMTQGVLSQLSAEDRAEALRRLHAVFTERQTPDGILFDSATWFITARKP